MYGGAGRVVAAIDIGGTKIDVALADAYGTLLGRRRLETRATEGAPAAVERITAATEALIRAHASQAQISAAGVACAGVVQGERILLAPNLPGWEDVDLAASVRQALGVAAVALTND